MKIKLSAVYTLKFDPIRVEFDHKGLHAHGKIVNVVCGLLLFDLILLWLLFLLNL